eukprot:1167445-Prorocentrum_minimum.AAC.1
MRTPSPSLGDLRHDSWRDEREMAVPMVDKEYKLASRLRRFGPSSNPPTRRSERVAKRLLDPTERLQR